MANEVVCWCYRTMKGYSGMQGSEGTFYQKGLTTTHYLHQDFKESEAEEKPMAYILPGAQNHSEPETT